ncbi:chromophore lyase CpcT/CpeT [Exilibacterium tricleocarpae]|nr:chromophore lyase CpcT/CpeT [Exilibacterium tricleocarpae]
MTRRTVFGAATAALLLLAVTAGCAGPAGQTGKAVGEQSLEADFARLLSWFGGEYNNYEQVWQQQVDGLEGDALHEHIHHIFLPVSAPNIGTHTYFVKQYTDGDYEAVYRQRLYHFTQNPRQGAIQLTIYSFKEEHKYRYTDRNPDLIRAITLEELRTVPGCEVYWKYNGEYFDGHMQAQACHFYSTRSKKEIYITDTLRLTATEIWIGDKAYDAGGNKIFGRDEPHKNRKVRYFKGWMGLQRQKVDPDAAPEEWVFVKEFSIHNEGQIVPIFDDVGNKTGYSVQLARLTYQNTRQPILKLGLIEDASGKTVTYIWSEVGSRRLGMNLRWMQVGLTAQQAAAL